MNLLLIGAGQLGSRHLQSCLKFDKALIIHVLDNSDESLRLAKERALEVVDAGIHSVIYYKDITEIKIKKFKFLIIATSAAVRLKLLQLALEKFQFEYAILEKVLFQDLESYSMATDLITRNDVNTFVNCPLRTYPFFKSIKNQLLQRNEPLIIEYYGGEWAGLACNSIHYLDLMSFLSDELILDIKIDKLDEGYIKSKRAGCIELTGLLVAEFSGNSKVTVNTVRGSEADSIISIKCGDKDWVINELSGDYKVFNEGKCIEESSYSVIYQSDLTHRILEQIENTGVCELITYTDSVTIHKKYIEKLLEHFNKFKSKKQMVLPIT